VLVVAEINLKALTDAYASYVNKSKPVKLFYIRKIQYKFGNVIATFKPEVLEFEAYSNYTRQVML
tara:strand:+ start:393 stop:587 length:195 start_codon:yes stop_codon:yes gene_type:complete